MKNFLLYGSLVASLYFVGYGISTGQYSFVVNSAQDAMRNTSLAFFATTISVPELQTKYNSADSRVSSGKIRVLVMPGHEPGYGGAEHGGLKEREMTVELAKNLQELLERNGRYEVIIPRDNDIWNPIFANYFASNEKEIDAFIAEQKGQMISLIGNGQIKKTSGVSHAKAPLPVAHRLFGINKWVNENNVDIAIHIHFNDYPRKNTKTPGEYSGFSIYVPERQYSNSTTTHVIADSIYKRLSSYFPVSNYPLESSGVVEEQDLIAIGSANSVAAPSMLIEYGYIYEPGLLKKEARSALIKEMAFQTYLGLQDFFGSGNDVTLTYNNLVLPHRWTSNMTPENADALDVIALQTALTYEGHYPGVGKTKNDCPISGTFGPCTKQAIDMYQQKNGIKGEKGFVGTKTREALNAEYQVQAM